MSPAQLIIVQRMLNKLGYRVPVSGYYDEFTRGAVISIQQQLHITDDGELSPNTLQAIMEAQKPVRMAKPQVVAGSFSAVDAPTSMLPKPWRIQ